MHRARTRSTLCAKHSSRLASILMTENAQDLDRRAHTSLAANLTKIGRAALIEDQQHRSPCRRQSPLSQFRRMREKRPSTNIEQRMPISDTRKHAVSLDEPATEPTISPRPSHPPTEEANSSGGEVEETSANHVPEILAVKVPAIVRNAPSETAPKIGTATPGA